MSATKILPCSCASKYQDANYGLQQRVHNECKRDKSGTLGLRCTVCGSVK